MSSASSISLKSISDAFGKRREALEAAFADPEGELYLPDATDRPAALRERYNYMMTNVFWVPEVTLWEALRAGDGG